MWKVFFDLITGLTVALFSLMIQPQDIAAQEMVPGPGSTPLIYQDFPMPKEVYLCGERMPLEKRDVYERLDLELALVAHGRYQVFLWFRRAGRYFPHIEKRLAAEGLPLDLKYLAVAESDLRTQVSSPARALGAWQFIAATARRMGLTANKDFDERRDFERSTEAAMTYLKKLKDQFGSWTLAMAAYNCGEGRVAREIKEQDVRDYYRMNLPGETERYIFRIAAIKIVMENPEKFGYLIDPRRAYPPIEVDTITVNLRNEVHFTAAAKAIGSDYKTLKDLNAHILGRHLPKGSYRLDVPKGMGPKMAAFLNTAAPSTPPSASRGNGGRYYVVQSGDTLHAISQKTGVSVDRLQQLNNISGSTINIGQKLKLEP